MPLAAVEGRELYYELHGRDRPDPPLVLLNGAGGSCRGWLALQVPEFAAARPTLILDYPGVGESEPYPGNFDVATLARSVAGLLETLALRRVSVLGTFLGGMVAQELALTFPERLERLVLVGTWARADAKRQLLLSHWQELARAGLPIEVMVRHRLLWTASDATLEQGDLIDSMLEPLRREGPPLAPECFARQCQACREHDALDRLHRLALPTLVVCGRDDQLTPPHFHRQLADEIPAARLVTFARAAHLLMVESAESFNRAVLEFLEEPASPTD